MKVYYITVLLGCIAYAAMAQPEPEFADAEPNKPEIEFREVPQIGICVPVYNIDVYDADTVTVEIKYKMRVRLIDCWGPEIRGPQKIAGERAKQAMRKICQGKDGLITIPWHDDIGKMTSMGRVLGKISVNGDDIGYSLIRAGHAVKTKEEAVETWGEE